MRIFILNYKSSSENGQANEPLIGSDVMLGRRYCQALIAPMHMLDAVNITLQIIYLLFA